MGEEEFVEAGSREVGFETEGAVESTENGGGGGDIIAVRGDPAG